MSERYRRSFFNNIDPLIVERESLSVLKLHLDVTDSMRDLSLLVEAAVVLGWELNFAEDSDGARHDLVDVLGRSFPLHFDNKMRVWIFLKFLEPDNDSLLLFDLISKLVHILVSNSLVLTFESFFKFGCQHIIDQS